MLILFAALAWAGVVASHLWADPHRLRFFHGSSSFADDIAVLGGRFRARFLRRGGVAACGSAAKGASRLMARALRHVSQKVFESHQAGGTAKNVMADFGFDVDHQFLKNLECLGLVLD